MRKIILLILLIVSMSISTFSADKKFEKYSGGSITYNEMISSPKVVLFLWTTSCPYCREELKKINLEPNISQYAKFYFVDLGEERADVGRLAKSLKLKGHIVENIILDKDIDIAERFSVVGVPTFIYLRNGKIVSQGYYFDESALKNIFGNE